MLRRKLMTMALVAAGLMSLAAAAEAAVRQFSYDPADDLTRRTAGSLTFEFKQRLLFVTVLRIRSTEGSATAVLKPTDDKPMGHGGLDAVIGPGAHEHDLYSVVEDATGLDMVHAFCPGSNHAWLAFGRLQEGRDLRIHVIGDTPAGGPPHKCETLDFNFRGEWQLPPTYTVRDKDLPIPHFPYS